MGRFEATARPEISGLAHRAWKSLLLLPPGERWRWWLLVPAMGTAAMLEAAGAALIFTLVEVVHDRARAGDLLVTRAVAAGLGLSPHEVLVPFSAAVAGFYLVKNATVGLVEWFIHRRAAAAVTHVSARLLTAYLAAPFSLHLGTRSSALIRNVHDAVELTYRGALLSMASAISELVLALGLFAVLVHTAPELSLGLGLGVGGFFLLTLTATRRAFTRWGEAMHRLRASALSSLQQGLGGMREVRVLGREAFFADAYRALRAEMGRLSVWRGVADSLPRLLLETAFVTGVCGMVVGFFWAGELDRVVVLLGVLAYAGFRLFPVVQRILHHIAAVRFSAASMDELLSELGRFELPAPQGPLPARFERSLRFESVSLTYPDAASPALAGLDLELSPGERLGVVGPTGAGKSTFIDLLLGLLDPTEGTIFIDGEPLPPRRRAWQRRIGFVPQSPHLLDDTLTKNVAFGVPEAEIDEARVKEAARLAQLGPLIDRLPHGLHTVVGERGQRLSGGERQRVAVARALYHRPSVLVFDEATSALDTVTESALMDALDGLSREHTVVLVAHRIATVAGCDRILVLEGGIATGLDRPEVLGAAHPTYRKLARSTEPVPI